MATESPIRMMESGGKWVLRPGAASATYTSSPVNICMDEDRLPAKSQYQSARGTTLNRSGSAPPSMEGSLQAWENLMQSSSSAANYPSNVKIGLRLQHPVISGHIGTFDIKQRSSSSIDVTSNCLNFSRSILPTHKEESEGDRSPKHASDEFMSRSSPVCSGPDLSASVTWHKILVNNKKEDLHCPPSPASDQFNSLCPGSAGKVATSDADWNSSPEQPVGIPNMVATSPNIDDVTSSSDADFSPGSASRSVTHVNILSLGHKDNPSSTGTHFKNKAMAASGSETTSVESGIKALKITPPSNLDIHKSQEEWQFIYGNNFAQHQGYQQNSNPQFQTFMPQVVSHGMNNAYVDINHIPHLGKFPSAEMQPVLQSLGFTPPHYAATTAYMPPGSPYFSGLQPPGVIYSPQYGIGGYAFNPVVFPPYLTAYSPHSATTAVPFNFDNPSGLHYNPQAAGVASASGSSSNVYTQNLNKFYGQFGTLQHPFADPQVQFHSYGDFPNVSGYIDPIALRNVIGGQGNYLHSTQRPGITVASADHRPQNHGTGWPGSLSQRTGGVLTPSSFGGSPNVGVVMHIPASALPSPVLPASPIGGSNLIYARNEGNSSSDSGRNARMYAGWHGQREYESLGYTKPYSFLEEVKSGKGRRLELVDITGQVVEFSVDQHGSRFIQQKLENCSVEEKASVFREVLPNTSKLMTDVFGNYVIQKFFEYGTPEQRKELANQLQGQILPLSLQMYGCRVIQKALDVIELEQKVILVHELDGHVMRCVRDQNGNHVIQKCIESIPTERIDFIISAFRGQAANLSMHPYGCRVIQRILEHCADGTQSQFIVDEILESICILAQNQYGNYVTQHVLERGKPQERLQIIKKLAGQLVEMSQHKFASNVIEKCLEYGDTEGREILIREIVGTNAVNDNLLIMMKDQYANYVVQKLLEMCTDTQRDLLLGQIQVHLNALKKYTYGKHIVARFEQFFGEEIHASES